ncbi:hypothetical protein DIJ64_11115 [Mycobacterium leprae]|uniref:Transposase n=1 Tax=Mycobacterium leprae TaxID=1769 RepID=A0AAD0KRR1_MYCLR|nr:hypothetical protein DIJ64_11115 [Mycobacterium leprae]
MSYKDQAAKVAFVEVNLAYGSRTCCECGMSRQTESSFSKRL